MKKILTEKDIRNIVKEVICEISRRRDYWNNERLSDLYNQSYERVTEVARRLIQYLKKYGQKGILPSYNGDLSEYHLNILQRMRMFFKTFNNNSFDWKNFNKKIDNFFGGLVRNRRGLIYVERAMTLDDNLMNNGGFSSVGECWTWRPGHSSAYYSESFLKYDPHKVILCGYVHPSSIDWFKTWYLNTYELENECEMRMNRNAIVEISAVYIDGKKYSMSGHYLLNASADRWKDRY